MDTGRQGSPDVVLDVTDPTGRQITLERKRWEQHIARRRPEFVRHPEWIEDTIRQPSFIYDSATNEDDLHYYLHLRTEADGACCMSRSWSGLTMGESGE